MAAEPTPRTRFRWLNRNVIAIGLADLASDANYEMVLAVLPLFLVLGLGAPVFTVGVIEAAADASSVAVKLASGSLSDRVRWRQGLGSAGYALTAAGLALLAPALAWPQVLLARALAWIGRGVRQPVRSAMLAGSVEREELGKAFGFHQAMDSLGAVIGPAVAFFLVAVGRGYRTVFVAAIAPGVLSFLLFALLVRDPRRSMARRVGRLEPLPGRFWRLTAAVALFGLAEFAPTFFILRASTMVGQPERELTAVLSGIGFYVAYNALGSAASFPGGWLADRVGRPVVLLAGYLLFAVACDVAIAGHGPVAVGLLALTGGVSSTLVRATEGSLIGSIVDDPRRGTAFGVLTTVNAAGDVVSSLAAGLLWSIFGAPAAFAYGTVLAVAASLSLMALTIPRPPRALP